MVRSRKYALVTAALALILIAAVVLTVVLVGDGSFYAEKTPQGSVSSTAVSVGSSTGEVSSDYIYQTLLSHSQKTGEWEESDMQDLQDAQGNRLDNGSTGDGVKETYVTTLKNNFRLLTQNGWDDVAAGSLNVPNKSWGGSGYYEVFYNGAWYRFKNGNSSGSLYMSYNAFMTDTDYYQNSFEYALIIEPDGVITYNPNDVYKNLHFDATLDGAGATLRATTVLNKSRGNGGDGTGSGNISDADLTWFTNHSFNYNIGKDSNDHEFHGLSIQGLVFGSLRKGTFKNFKWDDQGATGTHYSSYNNVGSATTFGGLVGYAGPSSSGGSEKSSIYNVSLTYNNAVQHVYDIGAYDDWDESRTGTFTGGLIGVNFNANIELVTVRMNNDIAFEQRMPALRIPGGVFGWQKPDNALGVLGGIVALQNCSNDFKKVIISGSEHAELYSHHEVKEKGGGGDRHIPTRGRLGMVVGMVAPNNNVTFDGAILDFNYNECYGWKDVGKDLWRGMLVGENVRDYNYNGAAAATSKYQDIYITSNVFAGDYANGVRPGPADVGRESYDKDNVNGYNFQAISKVHGGYDEGDYYNAQYWFDGNGKDVQSFAYIEESKVGAVSFSDETDPKTIVDGKPKEYMLEISAPQGQKGVYWNVKWSESGGDHNVKVNNDVFTQNSREDVKVHGFGAYSGNRTSNGYLIMTAEYASSYQLTPRNGVNNNGGDDKDYDKTMVNFPTLKASFLENYEMENHDGKLTQNGYITIGDDGSGNLTFMMNNGSTGVGNTIEHIYIGGTDMGADISGNIGSILQLERTAGEEFQVVENNLNAYRAEYNANVYRWTLMGLFAVEDSAGNKTVFAPVSNGINVQVEIDKRPIYMDVVADEVPYIGSAYGVQYGDGSAGASNMVYYQFGTTATNGNGQAVISGDNVTLSQAGISGGQAINVGDYSVTAQGVLSGANNYQLLTAPGGENEFSIVPAEVTLRVTGGSMPYGTTFNAENRAAFVEFVDYTLDFGTNPLQNFAERDGISLNLNLMTTASATTEGQYLFTPSSGGGSTFAYAFPAGLYDVIVEGISGIGSGNYSFNVAQDNEQFEVAKLPLSVTLPSVSDFTYGELDAPALSADDATVNGLRAGDSVTKELRYYLAADDSLYSPDGRFGAGAYYAQMYISAISSPGSVNGVDNYAINYGKSEFDVLKRDTYVSFDYDPSLTYTYKADLYDDFEALELIDGADGDTVDDVLFAAYSDPERKKPAEALNAGTYYPGATSETLSANYNILGVRDKEGNEWATFVIEKASATLALGDQTTAEYSGNAVPFDKTKITITVADALKGEVETILREALTFTYNGAADAPVNAGTYAVTVTLPELTNYKSTSASLGSVLMITQMKITITPESERVEEEYDGTVIPNLTFAITGSDDRDLSGEITPNVSYYKGDGTDEVAVSLRDVGTYTIVYSYNGATGNYASAEARVTYVVTPATLQITLNNPTAVYNKKAYTPDFKITSGLIVGDNANITYKVNIDEELHDNYEIKDAGSYTLQFSAGNSNYVIAEDDVQQIVAIEKYVLSAQAVNKTVFFSSENLAPEYYENQLRVRVTDADGSDIGDVTIAKELLEKDGSASVTEVNERGGDYQVKVTVTLPNDPVKFDPDNYDVRESVYSVFIYRIALSGELNGGTDDDSVEYGNAFNIKGVLTAMAGGLPQALEVDETGAVIGISENPDLTDVTSITITQATISVSGTTLAININSVSLGNISSDVNAIFNTGIFNDGFKNAGTYTATIEVTLNAEYTEPSLNRPVTLSAPFTWTVDPYAIDVTLGQLNKYYTEAITADDVMGVVGIDEKYKSFVTAVSSAIGDGKSYVNAGEYDYDLVLNTTKEGYFNYTLPAVETGKINVQQLTVQVSAADATVEYGNAVTPKITIVVLKGDAPMTAEEISALGTSFTSQYSYTTALTYKPGDGVGLYEGAIVLSVTATKNFTVEKTNGNVNVIPRKIQITLGNLSMVYGTEQLPALTYTLTGGTTLFTGDDMPALATDGLTLDSEAAPAVNRINANSYAYDFTSLSSQDENYEITAHNGGTLTVTPYVITSVTWDTSAAPVYKGSEFDTDELYTIAEIQMPNGDVVAFGVTYTDAQGGVSVKNVGSYTAAATVASVKNGKVEVEKGNYDVSRVATQSLTVSAATLSLSAVKGVQAVNDVFAPHVYYDISGAAQELVLADFTFVFGEDQVYDANEDGELTFSVTYSQSGLPVSPVNAGAYDVSVTVNGSNFNRAVFANIVLTIDQVTLDTLDGFAEVIAPENIMFDNLKHEPTVNFVRETATYSFTYFKVTQSEEGDIVVDEQSSDPIDAADYYARIVVDSANVHYETAGDYEVEFTISPTDKIAVDISVPTSAGLNDNNVYYNGTAVIPVAQATITQNNPPQVTVTGDDEFAFTYKFHMLAPETDDESTKPQTVEIEINGKKYEVLANYHNLDEAIETGSYYIEYWFNKDLKHNGNYVEVHGFLMSGDQPTIMQIVTGNMGTRFIAVTTQQYNGLAGYQGRDVIYKDSELGWRINTDLITFSGVNLDGMKDQMTELKTGEIVISVSYLYDMTDGVPRYTKLYDYTWGFDKTNKVRTEPVKKYYPVTRENNEQVTGPYGSVYDFGYANGQSTAVYLIEIEVDNRHSADVPENLKDVVDVPDSGSSYSSAMEVYTNEDGEPIRDDNDNLQYIPTKHRGSGTVSVAPASIEFEMRYTSDFYQSGADMLENGYNELNDVANDVAMDKLTQELIAKAQFIMRGVAIPSSAFAYEGAVETNSLLKIVSSETGAVSVNVTGSNYYTELFGEEVRYEVLDKTYFHLKVTDEKGRVVYAFNVNEYNNGSQNVDDVDGITNAGTYTFEFVFDGMNGKYLPFSYTWDFVQQAAEYHITVTQNEDANLTTPFGTEFDLNRLNGALNAKLETGDLGTATGSYTNFVEAFERGEYGKYIKLVGSEGGSNVPYTDYQVRGVESPVGSYYISYVFVSKDPNLEIMMETAESMIEVKSTAPKLIQVENGETIYEEVEEDKDEQGDETSGGEQGGETGEQEPKPEPVLVGYDIGNVSFAMNTAQNEYVLGFVKLGLEYTTLIGNAETYDPYLTTNVGISKILYLPDGADEKDESAWVEYAKDASIMSVGKYKIWFETVNDPNLEGAYEDLYVLFEIVKIEATAYVTTVGGISVGDDNVIDSVYNGSEFTVGWAVREANGSNVSQAALAGTVVFNIYTKLDGENKPDPDTKVDKVLNAGTYYVSVSVEGSTNYNVTASAFVTVTIAKADLRVRFGGSDDDFKFIYSRDGSTIDSDTYSFELNNARVDLGDDSNAVVYYLTKDGETIGNETLIELVKAYLGAVKAPGSEDLTIDEWLKENEKYAGYEFTSVKGTNAATDVGTYYPIVVYGGDTNFNKSANLIENGVYPEITVSKAIVKASVSSTWIAAHELEYGEKLIVENIDYKDVFTSIEWFTREGGATDDSQVNNPETFFAEIGASPRYEVKSNGVYNQGDDVGTYAAAIELEITFESKNYDLEYTTSVADIEVKPKSVSVKIGDVAVKLGKLGQQTLVEGGVKFNGVYNGSSFGTLQLVVGDDFVFGIKGEGYDDTMVDADSGKYGVLTVTMSGTLAEGGAMIAGSYSSSVDFALNNANYTIDLYDGTSKLTTLGVVDGTPYSVPVSLDVAKAVLKVYFDTLTYKWLDEPDTETYKESVDAGSGEHQGWWEYATMYTGRNFRRNERLRIESGYYDGGKWVPYGVYAQRVKLGDIINDTELGIVVTDGESGMLAAAGEYSFHLAISSTNYEFERADKSHSSAIDVNITISPSEALEVNLNLNLAPEGAPEGAFLFTKNGEVWEREFDGMTITTRTIMGEYLKVYRYEIPQGANALTGEVTLKETSLGDVTDGVFAQGVNVTLAGDNAVGGSIIYAGDYDLTVNVNMDNMAERTEVAKLKITPAQAENVDAEITNRSKSSMTYNGSSIVPSFDFKITVKEALSDVTHTQKVNSYSVRVSKDGEELFTYAVEGGVVNMTDEQRAMLANAGVYTFELIVDSATMPNLEDGATFYSEDVKITIVARDISDSSIRWSYRDSFDFKSANGEPVAVTKEGINFIAYYNRDTLLEDGTDYELTFVDEDGEEVEAGKYTGTYHIQVTGMGNFKGELFTGELEGTYHIGASVGPTEAPAALTYGADNKVIVKLAVNSLAPGSADIINDIHLAFDAAAIRLIDEGGRTVSQLRFESQSTEGGTFIAVFGGVGAVNAGTYYLDLSFSCEYEDITSGGEINIDVSGRDVCEVVVQPASAAAVADSVNAVLTAVNSNNLSFVIDGKANGYEYSIDGETWVKAYKGENTVTGLTPETKYTVKFRLNDSNYAEGGVTEYPLAVQLTDVYTTMNVDNILADAQDLAGNFNMTGFGRYVELMDDLNSVSVADREARAEEIAEALAAIEEARSEYMADLQAAIDSAVDTAEKATGKGIGVSAVGTAAVVGGAAMPAALGIGFIFAAARKRKSKEEDLND